MKRAGIKTFKSNKKYQIEGESIDERLDYCLRYKSLFNQNQNLINLFVFTDESTFYNNKYQLNYTRSINGSYNNQNNFSNHNNRKFKINVYGILSRYSFSIYKIDGKFTREKFRKLLIDDQLLDYMTTIVGGPLHLIQDNTTLHQFDYDYGRTLSDECERRNINLIDFPISSPDLNIIENVWGYLKKNLFNSINTDPVANPNQLFERILSISERVITPGFINNLYGSYNYRLQKVIESGGNLINY